MVSLKNKFKILFILSLMCTLPQSKAQKNKIRYFDQNGDTIFNQTDPQGLKQGYWKTFYDNGNPRYNGFFRNSRPSGTMLRYNSEGWLQAKMTFRNNGEEAYAVLYYNNEYPAAEGKYIGQRKDSLWKYFSYYTHKVVATEWYNKGLKKGTSERYYENGELSETIEWENNKKNGKWIQYFENGQMKLEAQYVDDVRDGDFTLYYPDGKIEQKGQFKNNLMEGEWEYYLPDGEKEMSITFENGNPKDPDKLLEKQREFLKLMEENKGKIPEPADAIYGEPGPGNNNRRPK